jgi:hypothetical protein
MGSVKLQTRGREVIALFSARTWEGAFEVIATARAQAPGFGYKVHQARVAQRKFSGRRVNVGLVLAELGGAPLAELAELEEWLTPLAEAARSAEAPPR